MNDYINLYMDNPTAGATDGTAISLDGKGTSPLQVVLDASIEESKIIKCAVRCEEGFQTKGDTVISFRGENAAKWKVAADDSYADETAAAAASFASSLTIPDSIGTTNKIFWVKALSSSDETPGNDTSVSIDCAATIAPV